MTIEVRLHVVMAERRVKSKDLAEYVGISLANLSLLKHGKVRGVRFHTLDRICEYLDCEPGDIIRRTRGGNASRADGASPPASLHPPTVPDEVTNRETQGR